VWHDVDEGPVMKVLPTIKALAAEPETIVISLDDDQCLPRSLIQTLISGSIACQGKAVFAGTGNFIHSYMPGKRIT
jgi:hypothetical protein